MIFTLEIFQAFHGDSLILHYGIESDPKIIVIDGGPGKTYQDFLKPRLKEIKQTFSPNDPLPLSMVMVSHLDDDHVNGILKLADDANEDSDFKIDNLWFNTFDDIVGNIQIPVISSIRASASSADASISSLFSGFPDTSHHALAVIASTGQGRKLRNLSINLSASVNNPFPPIAQGQSNLVCVNPNDLASNKIAWDDDLGLEIMVLHPNKQRLLELQKQWDKDLKEAKSKGDDSIILASIASKDKSPFNLSSIVCLVKLQNKTILFTGDARDDDIIEGLRINNLLNANGKIHVDILKVPHHGSDRNASRNFFEKVTADHYVISADGKHHNPDKSMLVMLAEGTGTRNDFTIHFTNKEGEFNLKETIENFIENENNLGRTFKCNFRKSNEKSIKLDLLEKVTY